MSWEKSTEAHRYLWVFVRSIHWDFASSGGTMTNFEEGGNWDNDFIIGAKGASPQIAKYNAYQFSKKFNQWLLTNYDVEFEDGVDPVEAMEDLAAAFAVSGSKLNTIGDIADGKYSFPSERS